LKGVLVETIIIMTNILKIENSNLNEKFNIETQNQAIETLESGGVLFLPNLNFELNENEKLFLKPNAFSLKTKSIKYNPKEQKIWGIEDANTEQDLKNLIDRYSHFSVNLIKNLIPFYANSIDVGNASLRTAEAEGRKQSKRHDDTRLHIDAFPSRPTHGKRLLRIFANINTEGKPRVWQIGESFDDVIAKFLPQIAKPMPFSARLMKMIKITKSLRTKYDHYMLNLHDKMKLDEAYQKNATKQTIAFNSGGVWVCFSDKTSHAVLSGRGLLEQTLYLKPEQMLNPSQSPLAILEKQLQQKLL
jgi:hypothetical protein